MRSLLRRWLVILQVTLFLIAVAAPAASAVGSPPSQGDPLIQVLTSYGIVKGDPTGNLNLDKPITRAEMITIAVRAMGGEQDSSRYTNFNMFSDIVGHWAAGYVNWATINHLIQGDGNGTVRPDDPISYAESLTLTLRLINQEPTSGTWPVNILLKAADLGLVPTGVNAGNLKEPAIRGAIFHSLAQAATTVRDQNGKTLLQAHLDSVPPTLSFDQTPASTKETSLHVTGTVRDAVSVTVNGQAATVSGSTFSATVSLNMGANHIVAEAKDAAGNVATTQADVTRVPPIASLDITGPTQVRPGGTATYTVTAKDSANHSAPLTGVTATVTGNIGTFDLNTGVLTAAATPASGQITLTAGDLTKSIAVEVMGQDATVTGLSIQEVNGGDAVSYTKPMTVKVNTVDANGQLVDTDYGRSVTLTATGPSGLRISPSTTLTEAGVATFTVTATAEGIVTLQATSAGVTSDYTTSEFGSNLRVKLSSTPSSLTIGGTTTTARITGTLVDENGDTITNRTGSDISIELSETGSDGTLTDSYMRILKNTSSTTSSGDDASFSAGADAGTAKITGQVTSGQRVSVDSTTISTKLPSISAGAHWDVVTYDPYTPGSAEKFYVRLVDSNGAVIPGNFSFQLKVATSNNDPENVHITIKGTAWNPVSDGYAETNANDGNDVIARTVSGSAGFDIDYNKPGQVSVTVMSASGTTNAYGPDGIAGTATNPGVSDKTETLTFTTTPTAVKLRADSDKFGQGQPVGATTATGTKQFTVTAYLTDGAGNWVPAVRSSKIKLEKTSGNSTRLSNSQTSVTASTTDGKATFTIYSTGEPGEDVYTATALDLTNDPTATITLQVQDSKPNAPYILSTYGEQDGVATNLNAVAPSDDHLVMELDNDPDQHWVEVKVYAEGSTTLLWTSDPIDVSGDNATPRVEIPADELVNGVKRYQITFVNGYGEGSKSLLSAQVTKAKYVTDIKATSAKYQPSTKILTLNGSGFSSASDSVYLGKITISDASTKTSFTLDGARVIKEDDAGHPVWHTTYLQLDLSDAPALTTALADSSEFSGSDVTLSLAAGWYIRANGEQTDDLTNNPVVGPMAAISNVVYDPANSRLYLNGTGFSGVSLDVSKLTLFTDNSDATDDVSLKGFSASRISDTKWSITLSSAVMAKLDAVSGYTLKVADGWATDGTYTELGPIAPLELFGQVTLGSATYVAATNTNPAQLVITGSGFADGKVNLGTLQLIDKSQSSLEPVVVSGDAKVVDSGKIVITLDAGTITGIAGFHHTDSVYVVSDDGWFVNGESRKAPGIPDRTLRLSGL